jgi:hypothetical protein
MMLFFSLIFAALAVLLVLVYLERRRCSSVTQLEDLEGRTRPVDLEAFRNLVDTGEEDFLRDSLLPGEFRAVQRDRMRAALGYIRNTGYNAAFLLRVGASAARSSDPRIALAGRQLTDRALRLRAYALLSGAKLYVRIAFPDARLSYGQLADNYQSLSALVGQLALMQHPTEAARLSTLL